MSNGQVSKGRLLQIKQGYSSDGIPDFENGEFGLVLDEGQEELYIGSNSGNIQVVTERNIAQLSVPDGSIGRTELDGEINTLLDNISNVDDMPLATTSQKGLMSSNDKTKLNSIETGANNTVIVNNLTSLSTTSALSAYQGKLLKDMIDAGGGSGGGSANVIDNLTSTSTTEALSANQGRVLKGLIDGKAGTTTATTSTNGLMSASDKQKLNNLSTTPVTVTNSLTSTSTTNALSAYQGKVLNEKKLSGYQSNTTASSDGTAIGHYTNATGMISFASGAFAKAIGNYSHSLGEYTNASGYCSNAQGNHTTASGHYSHSQGDYTEAKNYASCAIGRFSNMTLKDADGFVSSADVFVIGNGTSTTSLSNAFRVTFDGKVYGRSAYSSSGADYAEYFEWLDGNLDNEDRVGYFVTLDGNKIRKANSTDTYILGIISANPSVVGDSASEGFHEQYIKDDFGRIQYHYVDVEHEELDENGEKVTVIKNEYQPIYNPDYDNNAEYVNRENRPEWDAVGMMGKLLVRDDGTCDVNGYCSPNDDGIATKSEEGYRVMKRVSDNIIQVLIK